MRYSLILLAALAANAGATNGPPAPTPSPVQDFRQAQDQGQQQGQATDVWLTQSLNGNLRNGDQTVRGGDQSLTGGTQNQQGGTLTGGNMSGSGNVNVEGSYTQFIPPVVPPTPPSTVGVGNVIIQTMACGPLVNIVATPVTVSERGLFTRDERTQGNTYRMYDVMDSNGDPVMYRQVQKGLDTVLYGNQVVIAYTVVGASTAATLAIGGGSGGGWGQGGGGVSGAITQLVNDIQVRSCEVGTMRVFTPRYVPETPKPPARKPRPRAVAPCVPTMVPMCKR